AQFAKPEDAVKYRQSALTVMANHMGRLSAMAKGERPFDAAAAQASARVIDMVGQLPWEAFVAGTSSKGLKTEPWADAADFKARSDRLMGETAKLVQAAGSLDTLRAQVGATGAACKNCHEKYRN
ncbi:MAG: hypothetical protein RIS35_3466, partial [Pseudomonadota bacterium]